MFKIHELEDDNKLDSSVLTFGNFDGLHIGHQSLAQQCTHLMTFHPHPGTFTR